MSDEPALNPEPESNPIEPSSSAAGPGSVPDVTHVHLSVKLAPGTHLRVTIESHTQDGQTLASRSFEYQASPEGETRVDLPAALPPAAPRPAAAALLARVQNGLRGLFATALAPSAPPGASAVRTPPLRASLNAAFRQTGWGFWIALGVYLATRLIALSDFPMYFFTDEAVQTILASDFLRDGLRNYNHELLPTFFYNVYQYNLSVSVYLQVIPTLLFGKSVAVTRGVPALFSLIPAVTGGLALQQFFNSRYPWLAVLMLSIMPAWFLHSRTAFETSLAVSFYAGFLYFYLRYRQGHLRSLFIAAVFAALAFYTYSPAEVVVAVTAVLLFISDLRYHLRLARRPALALAGLGAILIVPYLRFAVQHPNDNLQHLEQIGSYWVSAIPLSAKLGRYASEYLAGLNPLYWFFPNNQDIVRHVMGNFGHLLIFSLPFVALGLFIALKNARSPAYRVLLIAILAAPTGGALVGLGITRVLFMVIPAALLGAIGANAALEWLNRRKGARPALAALAFFLVLAGFNIFLLGNALTAGQTWSTDYGLSGMQYGASQVFGRMIQINQRFPNARMVLSPTWTNGTDVVARFFLPDSFPAELAGIDSFLNVKHPFDANTLFILPPEEYQRALDSHKFTDVHVQLTIPWPNGKTGFYFLTMRYVDNVDALFAQDAAARQAMQTATVTVNGEALKVQYSTLDMGPIGNIFDGNLNSLIRTAAANPLKLQIDFPAPHRMSSLTLNIGGTATTLDVAVQVAGEAAARNYHQQIGEDPLPRPLTVNLGGPLDVTSLFIKLKNTNDPEPGHVHLWEISWK